MFDWLDRAARRDPARIALERPGAEPVSYAELLRRARAAAADLARQAVAPGDPVTVADGDRIEFAARLHGVLRHGAVAVPIDPRLAPEEQRRRAATARPVTPKTLSVMFTSGTTSVPKPVELTRANWEANALGSVLALGLDRHERWLCTMPLAHVGGLSILLRSALYGTTVVVHDGFDTAAVLAELADPDRAITVISVVPTMLRRLLDAGLEHPPTLRWALVGGGPIPPDLLARARSRGVPVAPTYGMTEACSQIATFGHPLHRVELSLAPAGAGQSELLVRGPVVAPGALSEDGWLHTGDLARFDAAGGLVIVGRRSDTIVSGGENVAPAEVEAVLLEHDAVADAGVFARTDPEWGEAVAAKVVLRPGAGEVTGEQLREFAAGRLARFKVPKQIEFADQLPRTASGKLLRRQLM